MNMPIKSGFLEKLALVNVSLVKTRIRMSGYGHNVTLYRERNQNKENFSPLLKMNTY